jgi:hypothetical protein
MGMDMGPGACKISVRIRLEKKREKKRRGTRRKEAATTRKR